MSFLLYSLVHSLLHTPSFTPQPLPHVFASSLPSSLPTSITPSLPQPLKTPFLPSVLLHSLPQLLLHLFVHFSPFLTHHHSLNHSTLPSFLLYCLNIPPSATLLHLFTKLALHLSLISPSIHSLTSSLLSFLQYSLIHYLDHSPLLIHSPLSLSLYLPCSPYHSITHSLSLSSFLPSPRSLIHSLNSPFTPSVLPQSLPRPLSLTYSLNSPSLSTPLLSSFLSHHHSLPHKPTRSSPPAKSQNTASLHFFLFVFLSLSPFVFYIPL